MEEIFYDINAEITQENIKKDIKIIVDVFQELNIRVFLHAGTLLSAMRDKEFIPYNNDYDFGVFKKELRSDIRKKIIQKLVDKGFILRVPKRQGPDVFKLYAPYTHCNTDFFIFDKKDNLYFHQSWNGYHYYTEDTLNQLIEISFMECKFLIPNHTSYFLEQLYGEDWKIPKKMKKPQDYKNWKKDAI